MSIEKATAEPKELTPEEIAKQERKLLIRERSRINYERRKANGKQKEYYERTKAKIREERKALKESLFDERYTLGASVLPQVANK